MAALEQEVDRAALRAVLGGVGEQVAEHLQEACGVGVHLDGVVGNVELEAVIGEGGSGGVDGGGRDESQVDS